MTKEEKLKVVEMIDMATRVPKGKRDYLLGYMQCIVDMNDESKRKRNPKNTVSAVG